MVVFFVEFDELVVVVFVVELVRFGTKIFTSLDWVPIPTPFIAEI